MRPLVLNRRLTLASPIDTTDLAQMSGWVDGLLLVLVLVGGGSLVCLGTLVASFLMVRRALHTPGDGTSPRLVQVTVFHTLVAIAALGLWLALGADTSGDEFKLVYLALPMGTWAGISWLAIRRISGARGHTDSDDRTP